MTTKLYKKSALYSVDLLLSSWFIYSTDFHFIMIISCFPDLLFDKIHYQIFYLRAEVTEVIFLKVIKCIFSFFSGYVSSDREHDVLYLK